MSAITTVDPEGAGSTAVIPANSDFSFTGRFYVADTPPPGQKRTFLYRGDDPLSYNAGVLIAQAEDGHCYIVINATAQTAVGPFLAVGWHTIQYTYTTATGVHRGLIDYFAACTVTHDINAETLTNESILTDTYSVNWEPGEAALVREWEAVLTDGEFGREGNSPTAVRTANLWRDTPLATDLLDVSGNGRDWTTV